MESRRLKLDGTAYLADVGYGSAGKVEVLEVGVDQRSHAREGGVRVRTLAPIKKPFREDSFPAGTEFVVNSRKIKRLWNNDDEQASSKANDAREKLFALQGRLADLGIAVVDSPYLPDDADGKIQHGLIEFTPEAVAKLLDLIDAAHDEHRDATMQTHNAI